MKSRHQWLPRSVLNIYSVQVHCDIERSQRCPEDEQRYSKCDRRRDDAQERQYDRQTYSTGKYDRLATEAPAQIRCERHRHNGTGTQEEEDQPHCAVAEMAASL